MKYQAHGADTWELLFTALEEGKRESNRYHEAQELARIPAPSAESERLAQEYLRSIGQGE